MIDLLRKKPITVTHIQKIITDSSRNVRFAIKNGTGMITVLHDLINLAEKNDAIIFYRYVWSFF